MENNVLVRLDGCSVAFDGQTILDKRKNGGNRQLALGDLAPMQLVDEIRELDVMSMSPIDALNILFKLSEKARRI